MERDRDLDYKLSVTHERWGESDEPSKTGHLCYPEDIDQPLRGRQRLIDNVKPEDMQAPCGLFNIRGNLKVCPCRHRPLHGGAPLLRKAIVSLSKEEEDVEGTWCAI